MQSTAGTFLRPTWRGVCGSRSFSQRFRRLSDHPLPCFLGDKISGFRPSLVGQTGASSRIRAEEGGATMSAKCQVAGNNWGFGGAKGLVGSTAVGRPGLAERTEQRRAMRTRMAKRLLEALKEVKDPFPEANIEFESPLDIVLYPDPRLRAKNATVRKFDEKLEALCKEMFDVMYRTVGVGLSAPQVGVNVRVMVYNPEGVKGEGVEYVLVNPQIVGRSKKEEVYTEGCLSFPQIEADVVRPLDVKVQAQNLQGKKFSLTLKGWKARIFQHEYDHLEGILYHDRMTDEVRDGIREELLELEKSYAERTGQPAPETAAQKS